MRRHSIGGVRKQNGRWYGLWYEGGVKKSRVLGLSSEKTKGETREAVARLAAGAKQKTAGVLKFGQFVETTYYGYYRSKWKSATEETNVNRVNAHLVTVFADTAVQISLNRFQRSLKRLGIARP